jgi:hypothetical protein
MDFGMFNLSVDTLGFFEPQKIQKKTKDLSHNFDSQNFVKLMCPYVPFVVQNKVSTTFMCFLNMPGFLMVSE